MSIKILMATALSLAASAVGATEKIKAVETVPHELDILLKAGHIQGACCSEQGVYLSHQLGIEKIGWDGRFIRRVDAPAHLGDVAYANGRIYGAFVIRNRKRGEKPGLVRIWDEDLRQIAERSFDEALDGIVVVGDTVYVGVDRWGLEPHAKCAIKRLGLDLSDRGDVEIDLGYWIYCGVQTMATDGREILLGNYGAGKDKGNPQRYTSTRLTPDLKVAGNLRFFCAEGFGRVPASVARRDTPVFFVVKALGGNMQGWRKDPKGNPPRIRLSFYEYANGVFTDITAR